MLANRYYSESTAKADVACCVAFEREINQNQLCKMPSVIGNPSNSCGDLTLNIPEIQTVHQHLAGCSQC